jgi:hypothetical protein
MACSHDERFKTQYERQSGVPAIDLPFDEEQLQLVVTGSLESI